MASLALMTPNFTIRWGVPVAAGIYVPSGGNMWLGQPVDANGDVTTYSPNPTAIKADTTSAGKSYVGFLSQTVTDKGPLPWDMEHGWNPGRPTLLGNPVSVWQLAPHSVIEVQAPASKAYTDVDTTDYPGLNGASNMPYMLVTSGTGALTTSTASGTLLSLQAGRFRVAQTGDRIVGRVLNQVAPLTDFTGQSASDVRLSIELFEGGLAA